jgi:uncharacterized membrane protein YfcA
MEVVALVAFALIGIIAGFFAGLLGIGGGIIIVPALILVFHLLDFSQATLVHLAIGTSLASIIVTTGVATFAHHMKKGVIWDVVFLMFPGTLVGCLLGGFFASYLSGIFLQIIFALFVLVLGVMMLRPRKRAPKKHKKPEKAFLTWSGVGIGAIASMVGISGGVFTVPLLMGCQYPEKRAIGTSSAVGFMITVFGALAYLFFGRKEGHLPESMGYLYLPALILIGITAVIATPFGVKYAHQIDGKKLRKIFAATLILVGIIMIFN